MKAKLKNVNGFTRFMLAHGEKLGMAAVATVAGLLIYSSLGRDSLPADKQPEPLKQKAAQADQHVRAVTWEKIAEADPTQVTVAKDVILDPDASALAPIAGDNFPLIRPLNPRVINPMVPRIDPILLAPLEPEANGMSGLIMSGDPEVLNEKRLAALAEAQKEVIDAEKKRLEEEKLADDERGGRRRGEEGPEGGMYGMGGLGGSKTKDGTIVLKPADNMQFDGTEDIRAESWVVVVAKVPIERQYQMYDDALGTSRGFDLNVDVPKYLGYVVERAEVTDQGQGDWTKIAGVNERVVTEEMGKWPIQAQDLVNPKYIHPLLTFPLPPMVIRPWNEKITHTDLPLPTPESMLEEMQQEMAPEEKPDAEEDEGERDIFAEAAKRRSDALTVNQGAMGMEGYRGAGARSMYGAEGGMMGGGILPRGMGMMGGAEGGMMRGGMSGAGLGADGGFDLPDFVWDFKTEYLLFRYFDRTVESGRSYTYRIRFVLLDVNANQPDKNLDPKVIERKLKLAGKPSYFLTDWSEPSRPATVPQPGVIYLAGADPASAGNLNAEPEAELVVKTLDPTLPGEVGLSRSYTRGSVVNSREKAQVIWSSLFDPQQDEESPVFDFLTGLTLLDFEGGESLGSRAAKMEAPARALVMNASGRMMLQSELDDELPALEFKMILDEAKRAMAEGRDEPRRGGRGGMER